MNTTMLTAVNTMNQLQQQMDVISNNVANIDTTGYKSKQGTFNDLLVQQINNQPNPNLEVGRLTPSGIRQGVGAKLDQVQINMTQGSLKTTGRPLDTAFQKEGQYFKVLVQNGNNRSVQFTRDGAFSLSPVAPNQTMLVTGSGNPVLDQNNNPIRVQGQAVKYTFTGNGRLNVTMANGSVQSFNLGIIQVKKPQFLEQKGNNLLGLPANMQGALPTDIYTNLTGAQRNQISIGQGMLEESNVDMGKELTDLMTTQRSYQFESRAVTLADQMMGLINSIR